nr:hypothetical protein [Tanacetum cinerariifolium]
MIPPSTHVDTTPIPIAASTIPPSPDYTPSSPDYTPASPDYSPASDTESDLSDDPSPDHITPLPATSPFLSSTDDSSDSDIPDTPPSLPMVHHSLRLPFLLRDHLLHLGALSPTHADILPPRKRFRNYSVTLSPEASVEGSMEIGSDEEDIDSDIMDDIEADIASEAATSIGFRIETDVGFKGDDEVEKEADSSARGIVDIGIDEIVEPDPPASVISLFLHSFDSFKTSRDFAVSGSLKRPPSQDPYKAIEGIQRDQGHRIVATGQQSTDMLERIRELERDNMRLRDMMDVASQGVTRSQCRELRVKREKMPNTRSGASRTREGVNEQIDHRLAGALGARDAARNLKPLMGEETEMEGNGNRGNRNGGNRNRENGNDNGNGGGYGYNLG